MKKNELNYKDLREYCNPDIFKFEDTFTYWYRHRNWSRPWN